MKILIILLALSGVVHAETVMDLSVYIADEDDSSGAVIGVSGGDKILWKVDINIASNFAGPSLALGLPLGDFKVYLGYQDIIRMDKQDGFVDVAGVPVFDPDSDAKGDGVYLEARYKRFFVRYTEYDIDYTLRGTRIEIINGVPVGFSGSEVKNLSGSVVWAGFIFPFR